MLLLGISKDFFLVFCFFLYYVIFGDGIFVVMYFILIVIFFGMVIMVLVVMEIRFWMFVILNEFLILLISGGIVKKVGILNDNCLIFFLFYCWRGSVIW